MAKSKSDLYEEAAAFVLDHFKDYFGLANVEGKQKLKGESGTDWEVDAKGVKADGESFIIVECKRYPKRRINQSIMAAAVYSAKDTGAAGLITVSPLDPQKGARIIAKHDQVVHVTLNAEATPQSFAVGFFDKLFAVASLDLFMRGGEPESEKEKPGS